MRPASGGMPADATAAWRPTLAHFRVVFASIVMVVGAVLWRRPDLLVLVAPLAIVSAWSVVTRPSQAPSFTSQLTDSTVREGEATTWHGTFDSADAIDSVVAVMPPGQWLVTRPKSGIVTSSVSPPGTSMVASSTTVLTFAVRAVRWGHRTVERITVTANSSWGAFRWSHRTQPAQLISLPLPATFDSKASIRRSNGLVGLDRSARPGDGSEFAGIRPFQSGDRMRRINWPRSLRAGSLHVTSTWADQDTHVVLEVDATDDLGVSEGVDGTASSIDIAVRAAGAIAEHYLNRGDRVTLRVLGSSRSRDLPSATGRAHLRRVLDTLAAIQPGTDPRGLVGRGRLTTPAEALVIMLSPLVSTTALERAVALARRGVMVLVVDTLAEDVVESEDEITAIAWRIRLLERSREIRIVQEVGVPVVRWQGPGSLDLFLRDVARRASAPRMNSR
jgi:uncharacterized protein (DUF58 family)